MSLTYKNPWEIEEIRICMDNEIGFLYKFRVYDDSKLIQNIGLARKH